GPNRLAEGRRERTRIQHSHRCLHPHPLWAIYPKWGWGTEDSAQALSLLKRFGSVTGLNGHIHQVLQKVEGKVTFHSARSTAFPQSEPGKGTPGPIRDLPTEKLKSVLGLSTVSYFETPGSLAIVDSTGRK